MLIERGVIKIGLEIEVAAWENRNYLEVCGDLIQSDYMLGPVEQWHPHHKYHCKCQEGGCYMVGQGIIIAPDPLVVMTYDGSLPKTGAEFITSPIIMGDQGLERLADIWNIITAGAIWTDKLDNYHGDGKSSPSVHLHVSATLDEKRAIRSREQVYGEDILHALELFAPELFVIADIPDKRRGLKYRLPLREAMLLDPQKWHHGFIHVRTAVPEAMVYIEWRLFEANYQDFEYLESCAYLAASLTRGFLHGEILSKLMATGYAHTYSRDAMANAVYENDTATVLRLVNEDRLWALRDMCVGNLDDDQRGTDFLMALFNRVENAL